MTDKNISENCKQNIRKYLHLRNADITKEKYIKQKQVVCFRTETDRVTMQKWLSFDTKVGRLRYANSPLILCLSACCQQQCIIDADGDRHAERSIDVTKRSILLLP